MQGRSFPLVVVVLALIFPAAASAQINLDRLRNQVSKVKESVDDARALRCDVQGVCGEVWKSDLFAPDAYETMAVAVFDQTNRYRGEDMQLVARDPFEGGLIENGFLLAGSTESAKIQERIGGGKEEWTDERLTQLKDFVGGIDAVLVIDIQQLQMGRCTMKKDDRDVAAMEISVSLSARWLNVDVGDIPWVARHRVTVCEDGGQAALSAALETAASQLATNLPARSRP